MNYIINESGKNAMLVSVHNEKETKLAARRRMMGYSQAVLAQKAGISLRTLQQYESRARDINRASYHTLFILAKSLQCPIEDIIEIYIDDITDCIRNRRTQENCETKFEIIARVITEAEARIDIEHGWKFDWNKIQKEGYEIVELYTPFDNHLQGRISFMAKEGFYFVGHVENRPENIGSNGLYDGVGANLFAIICMLSKQAGFDGFVSFYSKTDEKLVCNYIEKLHAKRIGSSQLMIIDADAADYLIEKYQLEV